MAKKFTRKLTRVSTHSYALEIVFGGRKREFLVRDWKKIFKKFNS